MRTKALRGSVSTAFESERASLAGAERARVKSRKRSNKEIKDSNKDENQENMMSQIKGRYFKE